MSNPLEGSYRIDVGETGRVVYEGWAVNKGASTSAAVWKISKTSWSAASTTSQTFVVEWAGGTELYNQIWDNIKTTIVYS
jgi:hypothetical protein